MASNAPQSHPSPPASNRLIAFLRRLGKALRHIRSRNRSASSETAAPPPDLVALLQKLGQKLHETPKEKRVTQSKNEHGETVTTADRETQQELVWFLKEHYPCHSIVGEEETGPPCLTKFDLPLHPDQFYWIIDPIDGTTNWAAGKDEYAITIGLQKGNTPIGGIVYFPATRTLIKRWHLAPPTMNDQPFARSRPFGPEDIVINYGLGKRKTPVEQGTFLAELRTITEKLNRLGCASAALLQVITEKADAYFSLKEVWTNICPIYAIIKDLGFYINIDPATLDLNKDFCLIVATADFAKKYLKPSSKLLSLMEN